MLSMEVFNDFENKTGYLEVFSSLSNLAFFKGDFFN